MKENEQREYGVVNVIANGTQLEGNIVTNGDIRVDGIVKGHIVSKAKVIVGREGRVEGNITCYWSGSYCHFFILTLRTL